MTEAYRIVCSDCGWRSGLGDMVTEWEAHRAETGHTHSGQAKYEVPQNPEYGRLAARVETLERIVGEYGDHFLKVAESIQNVMAGMQQFRDSPLPGSLGARLDRIETRIADLTHDVEQIVEALSPKR